MSPTIPRRAIDETGNRYGRLLVLGYADNARGARFRVRCDCGGEKIVRGSSLRYGTTTSCGCIAVEKMVAATRLPEGVSMWRAVLRSFKGSASERGLIWALDDATALALAKGDCAYCGSPPVARMSHPRAPDFILYNGVDRVDNGLGYLPGNVVSCCKHCNIAKRDRSAEDFINWARAVAAHTAE